VKKFTMFLFALLFMVSCAADRSSSPQRVAQFGWTKIRSVETGLATGTISLAFPISHYRGAVTLWLDPDSVGGTGADSCATVTMLLYNTEAADWGAYPIGASPTKLDTIDRAIWNVDRASDDIYIPLALYNDAQFAWADCCKVTVGYGAADIMTLNAWIGGQ
jgi:hypothetical protein